jgi:hypothetical protein
MNSINFLNRVKDIFQEEMCARFQQYNKIERIAIKHKNLSMIKGLTGFLTHMTKENYIE